MEGADGRPQGIAYWAAACLKNQEQSTRAEVKDNFQAVRLGINHKFGGPVVVKYGSAFSSAPAVRAASQRNDVTCQSEVRRDWTSTNTDIVLFAPEGRKRQDMIRPLR